MFGLEKGLRGSRRVLVLALTWIAVVCGTAFAALETFVTAAFALPAGSLGMFQASDPTSQFILTWFGILFILALIGLVVLLVVWRGANMKTKVVGVILVVGLWGSVILGALAMAPAAPGGSGTGGQGTALNMVVTPTVDTTASYPAAPFTACTSQNVLASKGTATTAGVVWGAISSGLGAQYNSQGPLQGQFVMQTGDQTAVASGGGKMSANCYQMKFTFSYTNAPPSSGGGSVYFPVFVYLTGVSYSAPASNLNTQPFNQQYNNGTAVNNPIFATSYIGQGAFPVLVKDAAGTWQQVCPNLQNQNLQFQASLPSCVGMNVNQNPTSNAITFTVAVDLTAAGMFGYATTDAATGSSLTLNFQIGLPQSQALPGYGGYYTPSLGQYSLVIQRTAA